MNQPETIACFQCQFCKHAPFRTLMSYLGHLAAKHRHEAQEKYPPVTVFRELQRSEKK